MTDLDTILEPLVREPAVDPLPVDALRRRVRARANRRRASLGIVALVATLAPLAVVASIDRDGDTQVRTPLASTASTTCCTSDDWARLGFPPAFDPRRAPSLLDGVGGPPTVAEMYLTDRLEAALGVGQGAPVDLHPQVSSSWTPGPAGVASVFWKLPPDEGGHFGTIVLRAGPDTNRWSVVAARTSGLSLSDLAVVDGVLIGTVESDAPELLAVDVLDGDRRPVPGSPDPDGHDPGSGATWGTIATSETGSVEVGVPIGDVAIVRAVLVDGGFRGISEVGVAGGASRELGTTTTTTATTTTSTPSGQEAPPWAAAALPASAASATVAAWSSSGSPGAECPAVAPADLGEGDGATARATTRGQPDAWWVAYDLPGGPGEADIQSPAAGVGKETFSVSAILPGGGSVDRFPNRVRWSDGSHGSYGPEGDGTLPMPEGVPYPWLAYLQVGDSPCLYQVHTYLGRDHIEQLLASLRFVEGAP